MWRAALMAVLIWAPAHAVDVDIGAPAGASATVSRERAFESYAIPIGPIRPDGSGTRKVEGAVSWTAYLLDDAAATTAAVLDGYRLRLVEQGFEVILDCAGEACGGFDFRFGVAILPPPAMLLDVRDFAQLSLYHDEAGVHVSVLASRVQERLHVQTVTVVPAAAPQKITDAPRPADPGETVLLPQDERGLLAALGSVGHVPVDGLDFDVGGAAISSGSEETLELLARILTRNGDLSVVIVGHSDNQGGLEQNIALSQRRAEAVMQALIQRGVAPRKLDARGIGYLAPVTSNGTEEGRARNRRVELVLR